MSNQFQSGLIEEYRQQSQTPISDYRTLDGLAVASFVFGLLSILTCAFTLLGIIPVLGIVLGIMSLRRIRRAPDVYTGTILATAGIALSVLLWIVGSTWAYYSYYAQAPPGYQMVSYATLQPDPDKPDEIVPPAALELDGEKIYIRGYMTPGRQQMDITQFILRRDNGVCGFCVPEPKPTELIRVELLHGLKTNYSPFLIGLGGKLTVKTDQSEPDSDGLVYRLEVDHLR